MKKSNLLLVLLLYLAITSCARLDTPVVPEDSAIPPMTSTFVTEEMAISEVEEFLKNFDPGTKSGSRTIAEIYPSGSMPATRSESDSSGVEMTEPFVYIVNFTNDEGFAIVSGDTRMSPILAITDHGNLEQGEVIDGPGTIAMLANIDVDYRMAVGLPVENPDGGLDYPIGITNNGVYVYPGGGETYGGNNQTIKDNFITIGGGNPLPDITYSYSEWKDYTKRGELVGCEWGQSIDPYNRFTYTSDGKKTHAGCVATAVAQIMYYWGKDFSMDGYTFDWDLMHKHIASYNRYESAYDMIGELFLKLGLPKNLDMDYRDDGSYAYDKNVPRTFVNCGYASGGNNESYNYDRLYNKISAGPAYISGCSKKTVKKFLGITVKTTYSGGHAWVIDQVLTQSRTKFTYTDGILTDTATQYRHLVHCNFGWDSNNSSNGYYFSAQFDTNKGPVTRADETGSMSNSQADHYYQYKLNMNINISPR